MKLLSKKRLCEAFSFNDRLNSVFNTSNPNRIADIIVQEVSDIIEFLAPCKLIQHKNSYAPWLNSEYFVEVAKKNRLHKIALSSSDQNLWREFRNSRNKVNRMNTFLKKQYFYNKLNIKKLENDANDNENNLKEDPKFSKTIK